MNPSLPLAEVVAAVQLSRARNAELTAVPPEMFEKVACLICYNLVEVAIRTNKTFPILEFLHAVKPEEDSYAPVVLQQIDSSMMSLAADIKRNKVSEN